MKRVIRGNYPLEIPLSIRSRFPDAHDPVKPFVEFGFLVRRQNRVDFGDSLHVIGRHLRVQVDVLLRNLIDLSQGIGFNGLIQGRALLAKLRSQRLVLLA